MFGDEHPLLLAILVYITGYSITRRRFFFCGAILMSKIKSQLIRGVISLQGLKASSSYQIQDVLNEVRVKFRVELPT